MRLSTAKKKRDESEKRVTRGEKKTARFCHALGKDILAGLVAADQVCHSAESLLLDLWGDVISKAELDDSVQQGLPEHVLVGLECRGGGFWRHKDPNDIQEHRGAGDLLDWPLLLRLGVREEARKL